MLNATKLFIEPLIVGVQSTIVIFYLLLALKLIGFSKFTNSWNNISNSTVHIVVLFSLVYSFGIVADALFSIISHLPRLICNLIKYLCRYLRERFGKNICERKLPYLFLEKIDKDDYDSGKDEMKQKIEYREHRFKILKATFFNFSGIMLIHYIWGTPEIGEIRPAIENILNRGLLILTIIIISLLAVWYILTWGKCEYKRMHGNKLN